MNNHEVAFENWTQKGASGKMPKLLMVGGALLADCAAMFCLFLAQVDTDTVAQAASAVEEIVILENFKLASWCVVGAMAGAFLSIFIFPPEGSAKAITRKLAFKFAVSLVGGVLLTPAGVRSLGYPTDPDYLFFAAGIAAFTSVSLLHRVTPKVEQLFDAVFPSREKRS